MERKSSIQRVRFFNVSLPIENVRCPTVLNLKIFVHQISSKFAVDWTEIEKFLRYVRNLGFLKIRKGNKFAVAAECVSNDPIL